MGRKYLKRACRVVFNISHRYITSKEKQRPYLATFFKVEIFTRSILDRNKVLWVCGRRYHFLRKMYGRVAVTFSVKKRPNLLAEWLYSTDPPAQSHRFSFRHWQFFLRSAKWFAPDQRLNLLHKRLFTLKPVFNSVQIYSSSAVYTLPMYDSVLLSQ